MKAIMLAAGEGTRCHPFTHLSPKMTQQVCGIPILEFMLSWFSGAPEIDRLYVVVKQDTVATTVRHYLERRVDHVEEIRELFARLGYRVEVRNPDLHVEVLRANGWGTGGDLRSSLRQIQASDGGLGDDFLVCNSDYVTVRELAEGNLTTQLDISDLVRRHQRARDELDVAMTDALFNVKREDATRFGVADVDEVQGLHVIRGFREKPSIDDVPEEPWINAGVYVINAEFVMSRLDELLPDAPGSNLERTLLEPLARSPEPKMAAYLLDLFAWFDVGTLKQLVETNVFVASRKGGYL